MGVKEILDALRDVLDPEVGLDIVDMGLVYEVTVDSAHVEVILMTTSPTCPLAGHLAREAEVALRRSVPEALDVTVRVVRDPPWQPARMSDAAKEQLGWNG
jgi:metal-sulfur cluster biosynthetic enzyme